MRESTHYNTPKVCCTRAVQVFCGVAAARAQTRGKKANISARFIIKTSPPAPSAPEFDAVVVCTLVLGISISEMNILLVRVFGITYSVFGHFCSCALVCLYRNRRVVVFYSSHRFVQFFHRRSHCTCALNKYRATVHNKYFSYFGRANT